MLLVARISFSPTSDTSLHRNRMSERHASLQRSSVEEARLATADGIATSDGVLIMWRSVYDSGWISLE